MATELMYDRLLAVSNIAVTVGLNLLVHSTIIISAGLLLAYFLRHKGATLQSLILRFFFAAALLSPVMSLLVGVIGIESITFSIPSVHTKTKHDSPVISKTVEEKSSNLPQFESKIISDRKANLQHKVISETTIKKTNNTNIDSSQKAKASTSTQGKSGTSPPDDSKLHFLPVEKTQRNYLPDIGHVYIALTVLWTALSLFMTIHLIWAFLLLWYIKRNANVIQPGGCRQCTIVAHELKIEPLLVLESTKVKTPCVAGLFKPALLLPKHEKNMDYLTRDILLHEYAHVLRHDLFWNFLRQVGTMLLPIQPLMWILSHKIDENSDYACDDFVISHTTNHRDYARNLFSLAQNHLLAKHTLSTGVGIISFKSSLKWRIQRILDRSRRLYMRVSTLFVVFVSFLSVFSTFVSGLIGIKGKNNSSKSYASEKNS